MWSVAQLIEEEADDCVAWHPGGTRAQEQQPVSAGAWTQTVGRALGGVSAALGLPAVAAPERIAALAGLEAGGWSTALTRAVGARELAAAGGLLAAPRPWMLWGRVAGDAVDLGLLGLALAGNGAKRVGRTAIFTGVVAGITVADIVAAVGASGDGRTIELTATTTINRFADDVYGEWRRFDRLPRFMAHLDEVRSDGNGLTHWRASAPFGRVVEWDAEITDDRPAERISWRSTGDTEVPNEGEVRFAAAPGQRGTELHVTLRYSVPAGRLGRLAARYFGEEPHQQLDDDLRRFKQIMETGEVVRSDGAPWGKAARREFPQRPARPLSVDERREVLA